MRSPGMGMHSQRVQEKPKDRKKVLLRLGKYLLEHKWLVLLALLLTTASNFLALVGPALAGKAVDAIGTQAGGVDFPTVFRYCFFMLVFYAASSFMAYLLSIVMIHFSQKIVYQMRKDIFHKLAELPVRFFDGHAIGDIISRISYDVDTVNASLSNDLLQICTSAITVVGSLIMMIFISPVLVLVFAVTVPASIFLTKYMTGKVRPLFRKRSGKLGELNGYVEEILTGHRTTKAYHREEVMTNRFEERNGDAAKAYYEADYYGSMVGPSVNFINNLSLVFVSVFGALLYLAGGISLGNLSSFVLYSRKFSGPINEMANILSELQSACAAAERVFRLIDEEPEPADSLGAKELCDVRGDVEMRDVVFGYDPDKIILHGLNLSAPKGKLIAIVGPTGAGKTTIVNLLMRFYDPKSGEILVDQNEIRSVTRRSLRRSFAMVLQDTWLFHGTIFENLTYGSKETSLEEVVRAARAANIHDYIMSLPNQYDTVLDENGMNISQGQKQLLTIARAMLLHANMLILDEATSNVDTRTEQQIQAAMQDLMQGKTCFVIAHRLSTIQNADEILVVMGGEIIERGTHEQLLLQNGKYAELYRSQFH